MNIPKLQAALELWASVIGAADGDRIRLRGWVLNNTIKELKEAVAMDPDGLTAGFMLQAFTQQHVREVDVSAFDLFTAADAVTARLQPLRQLFDYVTATDVVAERQAFIDHLAQAVACYAPATRDDISELLGAPDRVAFLRRDALRSINQLHVDQFQAGDVSTAPIKYDPTIRQWWNVNSLLGFAKAMPAGISLHAVRHPGGDFESYFCFCIRTGGSLFVISDKAKQEHPLQSQMRRRPDRQFEERASRNWFPYELFDVQFDEESNRMFQTQSQALVPCQTQTAPLAEISSLKASELVWLTMMFDLLVRKFWVEAYQAPQLSYTAGAVATAPDMSVPVVQVVVADVASYREEFGKPGRHNHNWLAERYADQVPESALNLIADPRHKFEIAMDGMVVGPVAERFQPSWHEAPFVAVTAVDGTTFGTAEKLDADRKFVARYNFAKTVNALAHAEYKRSIDEVMAWYRERVTANMPNILSWCGQDQIFVDVNLDELDGRYVQTNGAQRVKNGVSTFPFLRITDGLGSLSHCMFLRSVGGERCCYVTGAKATYNVEFTPVTADHLAVLANCRVDELPVFLQHWQKIERYSGNQILERVDPLEWACKDPWEKAALRVRFHLSKRAIASLRKSPALPPIPGAATTMKQGT